MKKVTIKEFSRNTHLYLKGLPVLITKYGKDFAKVIKINEDNKAPSNNNNH